MRFASALLVVVCLGCAGSGRLYPCDADAGYCGPTLDADAGTNTDFVSAPSTVWHDGAHNSATDLVQFGGAFYAVFRHASQWAVDANAQLFVVRSVDGKSWARTATLQIADHDLRQPKLAVFGDKLFVVATSWTSAPPVDHQTAIQLAASSDGTTFTAFAPIEQGGLAAWRPRVLGGALFVSIWAADELVPPSSPNGLTLVSTADGSAFTPAGTPPAGPGAREGDIFVRANGDRWIALPERSVSGQPERQTFCVAPPTGALAWSCWSTQMSAIESPAMFEWNRVLFVAGKRDAGNGLRRTAIWQVMDDDHALSPVADIPPGFGDTGAPGIAWLDDDRALLTFHTTSPLDPHLASLTSEPTEVQTESLGMSADVIAVQLYLPAAPAGR